MISKQKIEDLITKWNKKKIKVGFGAIEQGLKGNSFDATVDAKIADEIQLFMDDLNGLIEEA